ncbi:MAG: ribosome recycling factor [Deltaproteobacteria bacterium]|nr:ribosome recycling factor [Deltaproteobacteria bacterium]MBW2120314.1 ribosome recycling factor [Deltaproteobacteria bacterium]
MDADELKEFREKMAKTLAAFQHDLDKIRTGRASLALFDGIRVDYYGTPTPLNQVASMAIPESRLITIKPWDASIIGEIEKAILKSELGLTPVNDGKVIRITIPKLTEERRRDLVKLVRKKGEEGKIAIRNIRREANEWYRSLEKEKAISQDELHRRLEEVQELTSEFIGKVDRILDLKEKEILEI